MIILLLLKEIGQRYNYKEIATDDVQAGMVLSFTTIAMFMNSRIQGLPQFTSEDIGSQISSNEVQAIKLWGKSKAGNSQILRVGYLYLQMRPLLVAVPIVPLSKLGLKKSRRCRTAVSSIMGKL